MACFLLKELPFTQCDRLNVSTDLKECNSTSAAREIETDSDWEGAGESREENNVTSMDLEQERAVYKRQLLMCHLNTNSIQNKFEELG